MGCCSSAEALTIDQTDLPPPEHGDSVHVYLQKKGTFNSDYDVFDISSGERVQWMLVDAVGGGFKSMKYYLKHHLDGEEEMTILGAAEITGNKDEFTHKIKEIEEEVEYDLDFDSDDELYSDDESVEIEIEEERKIKSKWKMEKKCQLYATEELETPIGGLKVKAKGKYKRKIKDTTHVISYENEDTGEEETREEKTQEIEHKTKLKKFYYKLKLHDQEIKVEVKKSEEHLSFRQADLEWTGTADDGTELFHIIGDGANCTIKTSAGTDPNAIILAAFACACTYNPGPTQDHCEKKCTQIHFDD